MKPQITLFFFMCSVDHFYSSLECCRALTRKRMKTNTTDLRSIEAPLAEGEEE